MAGTSWLPLTDEGLRTFCESFLSTITPVPTDFGLVIGDVTLLNTRTTDYTEKLATSEEPSTRTRPSVAAKRISKAALITTMRNLYKKVLAANLPADKMEALGLRPRDVQPTPIPAPAMAPQINIVGRVENTVKLKFTDPTDPSRRGRPPGVDGIAVFSYVGEVAPTTDAGWHFEGNVTRMAVDVIFPASVTPGSKVWLTAFFFNPRAMSGPAATPVSTYLPGGAAMSQAA